MVYFNGGPAVGVVFLVVLCALYFIPTLVALARHSHLLAPVVVINLLLGWTFIGWVIALVMAVLRPSTVTIGPPPFSQSLPVYSPDGRYLWDGRQWVPIAAPPQPPTGPPPSLPPPDTPA